MKLLYFVVVILISLSTVTLAQNNSVSIGTNSTNSSAVLWLNSPNGNQGVIIPVGSRSSVTNPAKGMLIFDTNQVYYHDGTVWNPISGAAGKTYTLSVNASNQLVLSDGTTNNPINVPIAGDVAGTSLGSTTVTGIQGKTVTLPSTGVQYLTYDATQSKWVFQAPTSNSSITLANGQILTGNGTTNSATTLSGDASLNAGAITVSGLQGKPLPSLPSLAALQLLSYNGTTNQWEFKDPTGANIMLKTVYDPTGKAADAFDLTKHTAWPANASGVLTNNGTGTLSWSTPSGTVPTLSANQLFSSNGTNTGISVGGDLTLNVSGTTGTFNVAKIQGTSVSSTAPIVSQVLQYNGTSWAPATMALGGTVTSVSGTLPISVATGTTTPVISISQANATTNGYLSSTDWSTFNGKVSLGGDLGGTASSPTVTKVNGSAWPSNASGVLTNNGSGSLSWAAAGVGTVTNVTGTAPVSVATGTSTPVISMAQANGTTNGYLSSTDWTTFNSKGSGTVTNVTGTAPITIATGSTTPAISIAQASNAANGYLSSADWATFNGKMTNPLTTNGDLIYGTASTPTRLAVGSNGQVLTVSGGLPTWAAPTGFTNPMTTAGDIIYGGASGTPTRLAGGATGFLKSNGTIPSWGSVGLATTDVSGTLPIANGGTGATTAAAARTNLGLGTLATLSTVTTTEILDGTIADIDVSASANINGTKINPTFGAQAVSTTSTLTTGSTGQFVVDVNGNITKINNIATSFPSTQGAAGTVLTNNGTGNLTWGSLSSSSWSLTGNSGTTSTTNFIGTTDANDLVFKTNGTENMRIVTNPGFLNVSSTGGGVVLGGGANTGSEVKLLSNGFSHFSIYNQSGVLNIANTSSLAQPNVLGTNLMTISSTGNVGIGSASPITKLNVSSGNWDLVNSSGDIAIGDATYSLKMGVSNAGGGAGDAYIASSGGTNRLFLGTAQSTATTQTLTLQGGNVGVGYNAPAYIVDINKTLATASDAHLRLLNSSGVASAKAGIRMEVSSAPGTPAAPAAWAVQLQTSNGGNWLELTNYAGTVYHAWGSNTYNPGNGTGYLQGTGTGLALMGGSVGIGNTAPAYTLDVSGDIKASGVYYFSGTAGANASYKQYIGGLSGSYVYITDHFIPILPNQQDLGTTTYRWRTLYTNNTVNVSDIRLKKEVKPLKYGLSEVLKLRPVSYILNDDKEEEVRLGLIAQEALKLVPEVVNQDKNTKEKYYGMSYTELIPVLINAIQEQQKLIEDQKKKIEDLKAVQNQVDTSAKSELEKLKEEIASIKKALGLELKASNEK